MDPLLERRLLLDRRQLFGRAAHGIGSVALASLLSPGLFAAPRRELEGLGAGAALKALHHAPRAKRVIYLCMAGAPSQLETWDHKPAAETHFDQELPDSVRRGQRITTMTSGQERFPIAPSRYRFARHGEAGTWVSELLPHTAGIVDKIAVVRSMYTEAINHDPAITFMQTGLEQPGRPSAGAWTSYGLGSLNADLPAYVVINATWTGRQDAQALYSRLWGSGFLPSRHQGVALRSSGDAVLFLNDPEGLPDSVRRRMLDGVAELNGELEREVGDPEIRTRIQQYEMAYRMQTSVPELMDTSGEPESVFELYGPDARRPGTFAASCMLARRLAQRGVRFVQIYHRGWDQHANLTGDLPKQCHDIDQAAAGLIRDLELQGMLDETLVIWGGEFGRTVYCQGPLTRENYGRDHHPRCFTMWLAGGGIRGGVNHGETDDFSYNIVRDPVHVHDLNATMLHCLGVDHTRLTYRHLGRDFRLTDVHGEVVQALLA